MDSLLPLSLVSVNRSGVGGLPAPPESVEHQRWFLVFIQGVGIVWGGRCARYINDWERGTSAYKRSLSLPPCLPQCWADKRGEQREENHPSCRNSKQLLSPGFNLHSGNDSVARGGGWSALSEAACPAALPERTVWGPPAPLPP